MFRIVSFYDLYEYFTIALQGKKQSHSVEYRSNLKIYF